MKYDPDPRKKQPQRFWKTLLVLIAIAVWIYIEFTEPMPKERAAPVQPQAHQPQPTEQP